VNNFFDCRHLSINMMREFLGCHYIGIHPVCDL
jgi:hypothetical protein